MRKKIILGLVTFVLAAGAYFALSSGDRRGGRPPNRDASDVVREFVSLPTTQQGYAIGGTDMPLRPGDRTLARVYDDVTGRLKYQFEATRWEPVSDTDYHVVGLLIQIHAPRGEITYISADTADVAIAHKASKRLEPKRGWLRGNVRIVVDRTTSAWRKSNPELADRYAHPEDLIHIELEEARFDMDQAELQSSGPIVVDSSEARIENVSGLTLQWNQLDNRIDMLHFKHGGRMLLRRGGRLIDFAMPGTERDSPAVTSGETPGSAGDRTRVAGARYKVPPAQANKPMSIKALTADEAAAEIRLEAGIAVANRPKSLEQGSRRGPLSGGGSDGLRSRDTLAEEVEALRVEAREGSSGEPMQLDVSELAVVKGRKPINTYRAVFTNAVVVEQMVGLQTTGKLEADRLEINFDFGQKLRSLAGSRRVKEEAAPAGDAKPKVGGGGVEPSGTPSDLPLEEDRTRLVLTWDGPLEMRPLRVESSEQTGQRFDAIAQGHPVKVESERGRARCEELVYRHERRQVWLSGGAARSVELSVQDGGYLVGREVFFDQRRGLARVDGAGYMIDERKLAPEPGSALASAADGKPRERVEIRWSRGVDIELGHHTVKRRNASTGLMEDKRKEFLQRAWFHGDVLVESGKSRLFAKDEVAATFGVLPSSENPADYIAHLDMSGAVRLMREDELIRADRLAVELTMTPEGENVPKTVEATGRVLVRQGASSFRADRMHAEFAPKRRQYGEAGDGVASAFGSSKVTIKTLEASGHVSVDDPSRSFRVRRAQTLSCVMRGGQELVRATIVSPAPSIFARVRFGEVAIHGHKIEIDMDMESMDVPGPGKAWMITQSDFGGNKLNRPSSVLVTWKDWTQFRLAQDYAEFVGEVHSETRPLRDEAWRGAQMLLWDAAAGCAVLGSLCTSSTAGELALGLAIKYRDYGRLSQDIEKEWRTFALDCDRLKIRFARVPVAPAPAKEADELDRLSSMRAALSGKPRRAPVDARVRDRPRPAHVEAEGHASALSVMRVPGASGRLMSRVLIQGDRIVADLTREQMSVPCAGKLLIEDYQFDSAARRRRTSGTNLGRGPLMSAAGSEGPSQTAITWANSMDFFVDRSLIAFDQKVEMVHRSGQQMVMREKLAEAMQIDPDGLRHLAAGRKATLSCGYLLLEFLSDGGSDSGLGGTTPTIRATDLKRLIAKHAVNLQDGTKSLMGAHLQYLHEANEVRLEGSAALEARIIDQDEERQRFNMWRGPLLIWNRETNRIEAPEARIRTSRR